MNIMYRANKAWMTSDLFCEWLDAVNRKMQSVNCHILLLIDNCSAHPDVECSNIKLVFLPPNTTAKLQLCDAGIIQAIKLQYCKRLLRRIAFAIEDIENATGLAKKVTLFDAIMWLKQAWDLLPESTIQKCFMHCGIGNAPASDKTSDDTCVEPTEEMLPLLDGLSLEQYA